MSTAITKMNPHQANKVDISVSSSPHHHLRNHSNNRLNSPSAPMSNDSSVSTAKCQPRKTSSRTNSRYASAPRRISNLAKLIFCIGTQILRLRRLRPQQSRQSLRRRRHKHRLPTPRPRKHPPSNRHIAQRQQPF